MKQRYTEQRDDAGWLQRASFYDDSRDKVSIERGEGDHAFLGTYVFHDTLNEDMPDGYELLCVYRHSPDDLRRLAAAARELADTVEFEQQQVMKGADQ